MGNIGLSCETVFTKYRNLKSIVDGGVILIVRLDDADEAYEVAKAAIAGGIRALEITFSVPHALRVIERLADENKDEVVIGAGTVLDAQAPRLRTKSRLELGFCAVPCQRNQVGTDAQNLRRSLDRILHRGHIPQAVAVSNSVFKCEGASNNDSRYQGCDTRRCYGRNGN